MEPGSQLISSFLLFFFRQIAQFLVERIYHRLEHFDAGVMLVVGFHHRPGSDQRTGTQQHFLDGLLIQRPSSPVAPVFFIQLPSFSLAGLARLKAS